MSKYGVCSGPYLTVFGLEKTPYLDTFHAMLIYEKNINLPLSHSPPQPTAGKHFNVVSTLFLGWYDVGTSYNVKSTLIQDNFEIYNVEQRRINVVYFNVDYHNVEQRRNNVVNMTIWKK